MLREIEPGFFVLGGHADPARHHDVEQLDDHERHHARPTQCRHDRNQLAAQEPPPAAATQPALVTDAGVECGASEEAENKRATDPPTRWTPTTSSASS